MPPTLTRAALSAAVVIALLGCGELTPTTGPVALRNAEHMTRFLCGGGTRTWDPREDGLAHRWRFSEDGTFSLFIEGMPEVTLRADLGDDRLPAGARRLDGRWSATETTLTLTAITTPDGAAREPLTLPLDWVDGKMRIGIGDRRYMGVPRR